MGATPADRVDSVSESQQKVRPRRVEITLAQRVVLMESSDEIRYRVED